MTQHNAPMSPTVGASDIRHAARGIDDMIDQQLWAILQDNPAVLEALLNVFSGTV